MADKSKIEWTDATWNPITGCTVVDEGCRNCYAAHLITSWPAIGNHPSRKGLARKNADGVAKWLDQPLRWKKPRRIFVFAHGDLFHESVPDEWIDQVFAAMALAPQHTFQVLTKRPDRMRAYLKKASLLDDQGFPAEDIRIRVTSWTQTPSWRQRHPGIAKTVPLRKFCQQVKWPLPHLWLGTSISDQASADLRIPELLATPAAIRFISAEPLLGPVNLTDLTRPAGMGTHHYSALDCDVDKADDQDFKGATIDWVIAGGESGPNARPMHPDWARSLRDQCAEAGVPFHFKQWGEFLPLDQTKLGLDDDYYHPAPARDLEASRRCKHDSLCLSADGRAIPLGVAGGYHTAATAAFTHTRDMSMFRIGKSRAGRLLDGREWNEFPGVAK